MSNLVVPIELITCEIFKYLSFLEIGMFSTALDLKVNYKDILFSRFPIMKKHYHPVGKREYSDDNKLDFKYNFNQLRMFITCKVYSDDLYRIVKHPNIEDLENFIHDVKSFYRELVLILNTLKSLETIIDLKPNQLNLADFYKQLNMISSILI
ncbi:MAG TPA: hypothetical protein VKR58_15160 [Aquella sp.]|nr:hypothetical protein [Aquella sp.]